jgi:uncharacterized DUF497 family protein
MESDHFEWDDAKAAGTLRERGLAFSYAATVFEDAWRQELFDRRRNYGEARIKVIGQAWDGLMLTVIYTPRGERRRIISARLANRKERADYDRAKST